MTSDSACRSLDSPPQPGPVLHTGTFKVLLLYGRTKTVRLALDGPSLGPLGDNAGKGDSLMSYREALERAGIGRIESYGATYVTFAGT